MTAATRIGYKLESYIFEHRDDFNLLLVSVLDSSRLFKLIDQEEANRVRMRESTIERYGRKKPKPLVEKIKTINVGTVKYMAVVPEEINKNNEGWRLTVKCPYCSQKHEHKCGSNLFPNLNWQEATCEKGKYEFMLTSKLSSL